MKTALYIKILIAIYISSFWGCSGIPNDFQVAFKYNYGIDSINTFESEFIRQYYDSLAFRHLNVDARLKKKIFQIVNDRFDELPEKFENDTSKSGIHPANRYHIKIQLNGKTKEAILQEGLFEDKISITLNSICAQIESILNEIEELQEIEETDIQIL